MPSSLSAFTLFCVDILSQQGRVKTRRMFGCIGLYLDDLFIAIIMNDELYLKSAPRHRDAFQQGGGKLFQYTRLGKTASLDFWTPPEHFFESNEAQHLWIRRALESALIAANAKVKPSTR